MVRHNLSLPRCPKQPLDDRVASPFYWPTLCDGRRLLVNVIDGCEACAEKGRVVNEMLVQQVAIETNAYFSLCGPCP